MTAEEIVLAVAAALERAAIPYMTVGGLAGIYYGITVLRMGAYNGGVC